MSSISCVAVGSFQSAATVLALAEVWNGSTWKTQATPAPSGATGTYLSGVSCVSVTACTAVGMYLNSAGGQLTLAEAWNGTSWRLQAMPNPSGGTQILLQAVSCSSATACMAVGSYVNASSGFSSLAESWDGTRWSIRASADPPNETDVSLDGVSCTSATACTAVGFYVDAPDVHVTLAERWDGTSWTIQTTPNPTVGPTRYLNGVSCTSATACIAVGTTDQFSGQGYAPFSESWDGSAWTLAMMPVASGQTQGAMSAVSCITASACTAAGTSLTATGVESTLAERWDGTRWTTQASGNPPGTTGAGFASVSCSSTSACTASGFSGNSSGDSATLAEAWNGTFWAIQAAPSPSSASQSQLNGVSCSAATACIAVGSYQPGQGQLITLAEVWNGTRWAVAAPANPSGASQSVLSAVSCTAAAACTAVGSYQPTFNNNVTLAERWDGTSWTIQPTVDPGGQDLLQAVSCSSATACTAVGNDFTAIGTTMPIAESWDGTNWTAQTISSAPGATYSNLFGVSCTSATACTAVGYYANSTANWLPLVERWDGTTWAVQTAANPAGSGYSVLHAVSCTSTTTCSAVGSANSTKSASTGTSLAESWDGTGWTVQPTPSPTGATAGNLNSVSCTSTIACTAVGYYADASGTFLTLPESWNGTNWTVQVGANPKAVSGAILNALSCTSASVCNAVGTLTTKTGISSTLAERHT